MNKFDPHGQLSVPLPSTINGGGAPMFAASEGRPLLTEALSIVRRRKWVIIGFVVAALVIGLIITLLMTPQYKAKGTIEIQRENASTASVPGDMRASSMVDQEFYETQYGLLQARSLAERVATNLRLQDDPQFFEKAGIKNDWFQNGRIQPGAPSRDARVKIAGSVLLGGFDVDHERMSRLVTIGFTSPDPVLAKRVVDAWGNSFVQATLERRYEATSYARKFLENRLAQLRLRIDASERQLVNYAAQQGIVNVPGSPATANGPGTAERSLAADDLATVNQALSQARVDRIQAESRLSTPSGETSEVLASSALTLRNTRAQLAADYARMMAQFEPGYPPARALQSQIAQLDRSIAREEGRVQGTIRTTYQSAYQSATAREQALQNRLNQQKTAVLDLRRRSIQYNIIQRDADTNRQLYDALLQRYKEIGVAGGVGANNISFVDHPEVPGSPSSPKLPLNLLVALALGLLLGGAAAWALEQVDQGITDPSEVESDLQVPLLGTIPQAADGTPLELLADRKSAVSEAYVSIQTRLSFTTDHGVPRTVGITSSKPAEGKSTTAFALALSMARSRRRVLLIDADMRSPSIHHLIDIKNQRGLSNYLSGEDLDGLILPSGYDNLSIMTAGPQPPSAPELLEGDRFNHLFEEVFASFDQIVVDSPPVMGLADAPLIGSKVEGMLYVIESHNTQKSMARVAISRLAAANVSITGAVLTKFDAKRAYYGYGYDYGYGYGYGDTAKRPS
jgi:succinoglycan biosynthesis transport protein ExoP